MPEGRGIFGDLTVRENLMLGAYARRARHGEARNLDIVLGLFPRLEGALRPGRAHHERRRAADGGDRPRPDVGAGVSCSSTSRRSASRRCSPTNCSSRSAEVRETGVGVLLVEQNAKLSLAIADRGYLIETGRIVGHGEARDLAADPAVREAYLGVGDVRRRADERRRRRSICQRRRGHAAHRWQRSPRTRTTELAPIETT